MFCWLLQCFSSLQNWQGGLFLFYLYFVSGILLSITKLPGFVSTGLPLTGQLEETQRKYKIFGIEATHTKTQLFFFIHSSTSDYFPYPNSKIFLLLKSSFSASTWLPHPVWREFHLAPGCKWCIQELSSSCPTSGTEPALPSHLPACADAPQCTSEAHWSSLSCPLGKTKRVIFAKTSINYRIILLCLLFYQ